MYFLYFVILCQTTTLIIPVHSYVVVAANVNDFRSIARKFVPKDLVNQIKALVLENGHKYYREPSEDLEQADRTVEYEEISKHDENSYELAAELKKAIMKPLANGYKLNRTPKLKFVEKRALQLPKLRTPTSIALTVKDIVQQVKDNLLQDFFDSGNVLSNVLLDKIQSISSHGYNGGPKATLGSRGHAQKPVYKSVPMKVLEEEVQFEAPYEDGDDKNRVQYYDQYYKAVPNKTPVDNNNHQFIYANHLLPKKNNYDGGKKVRFVKQVLVPAYTNQEQPVHVSHTTFVQPPNLGHQANIELHSNLEPQISMQQASMVQQPLQQQSNIAQQLALMQQQIDQLTKNAQDKGAHKKPSLQTPHLNIEAIDAHFHILPHQSGKEDENKTNDSQEDHVELTIDDTPLSEETAGVPAVTDPSTKALIEPGVVENEQFVEEDTAISAENDTEIAENKPEEILEINSNEDPAQDDAPIMQEVKVDNNVREGSETKVHTQEFGKTNAGEPIVEKTYNFDATTTEAHIVPVNINVPAGSARKVMLF